MQAARTMVERLLNSWTACNTLNLHKFICLTNLLARNWSRGRHMPWWRSLRRWNRWRLQLSAQSIWRQTPCWKHHKLTCVRRSRTFDWQCWKQAPPACTVKWTRYELHLLIRNRNCFYFYFRVNRASLMSETTIIMVKCWSWHVICHILGPVRA